MTTISAAKFISGAGTLRQAISRSKPFGHVKRTVPRLLHLRNPRFRFRSSDAAGNCRQFVKSQPALRPRLERRNQHVSLGRDATSLEVCVRGSGSLCLHGLSLESGEIGEPW